MYVGVNETWHKELGGILGIVDEIKVSVSVSAVSTTIIVVTISIISIVVVVVVIVVSGILVVVIVGGGDEELDSRHIVVLLWLVVLVDVVDFPVQRNSDQCVETDFKFFQRRRVNKRTIVQGVANAGRS